MVRLQSLCWRSRAFIAAGNGKGDGSGFFPGRRGARQPGHVGDPGQRVLRDREPQGRHPVHDRQVVLDGGVAGDLRREPARVHGRPQGASGRAAGPSHRRRDVGHGRGRRLDHGVQRETATTVSSRTLPRTPCTTTTLAVRRQVHHRYGRGDAADELLGGRHHHRAPVHRARRSDGVRLRAPARLHGPRARRRRPGGTAAGEPGLRPSRRVSRGRAPHQRGRLLGAREQRPLRHQHEHEPRVAGGPARKLPLQRVRPPLRQPAP